MARNIFNSVQMKRYPRNVFDHGHDFKLSLDMGKLVPIYCNEALPGDEFKINTSAMLRMAPMLAPIMHKVNVFTHWFFVPNRIIWDGWEEFIASGLSDAERPAFPYIVPQTIPKGTLGDYLGLPTDVSLDKASALPFYAYNRIYNDYYRDQNLIEELPDKAVDGDNGVAIGPYWNTVQKRAWMHDYFTAALPFAQKGDPVSLPIAGTAPVVRQDDAPTLSSVNFSGTTPANTWALNKDLDEPNNGYLYTDLSGATATTINELRTAIRLQEWFETNARGGTRYTESLYAHFGVKSRDSRLQRSEYISGTMNPMIISEVLQTAPGTDTTPTPQGTMAGHGISVGSGYVGKKYCDEHGYVIGIMSIMPIPTYQQGIPKHFSKFDPFDYAWPNLANLGEQEVKNREIYYGNDSLDDDTFGYVPRYAEYKYHNSRVAGDFRDNLSFWHMGRIFSNRPVLNKEFIEADPTNRIFAVTDNNVHKVYAHVFNNIKVKRALPVYGTPKL